MGAFAPPLGCGAGVRSRDDLAVLTAFFEARRGRLHAFRFAIRPTMPPACPRACLRRVISFWAWATGCAHAFALIKRYGAGESAYQRPIHLPVSDSVLVAVTGAPAAFTLDGGEVVFDAPPADGAAVTAGFRFDVPVRFDTDRLEVSLDHFGAGLAASVPLVEVRRGVGASPFSLSSRFTGESRCPASFWVPAVAGENQNTSPALERRDRNTGTPP